MNTDSSLNSEQIDYFGISNPSHLSAATKRALSWQRLGNEWFVQFEESDLQGDLAFEDGVVRRDPSAIIQEDGKYYVWYSKSTGPSQGFGGDVENEKVWPWDRCDIWYATSEDGWHWQEQGIAIKRGDKGAYDARSVFTCEIMKHENRFYLCYQTVKSPYTVRVKNQIGLSWSESPDGPWVKCKDPILSPATNGVWCGEADNRFLVEKRGDFDSHKVHDPCILPYRGKFYLYYKGEQMGEEINFGGRMIRHGVAIADHPLGPYIKSPYNPVSNSGHEVCVWPYRGGIASLITTDGPERNTIQWAADGINFEIMAHIRSAPHAIGLNRMIEAAKSPVEILTWGLTHKYQNDDYQYIRRFSAKHMAHHTAKGETAVG
ncbi:MAG: family 43 glycosylhydrolase [Chloroflexota bacterium]